MAVTCTITNIKAFLKTDDIYSRLLTHDYQLIMAALHLHLFSLNVTNAFLTSARQ